MLISAVYGAGTTGAITGGDGKVRTTSLTSFGYFWPAFPNRHISGSAPADGYIEGEADLNELHTQDTLLTHFYLSLCKAISNRYLDERRFAA